MERQKKEQIRVLFLGDGTPIFLHNHLAEGVGKTSIILTLVSETFPRTVPKTYHPVIISADLYMLPISKNTVLLDSSCKALFLP